jgi:hypothetical protein
MRSKKAVKIVVFREVLDIPSAWGVAMNSFRLSPLFAVLSGVALGAGPASAQPTPGVNLSRPPAYSPYLNLLRPGGTLVQNYDGLVRPQIQANQAIQDLAGSQSQNRQAIVDLSANALPATGHSTSFMNTGGYFLNNGGVGGTFTGGGAAYSAAGTGLGGGAAFSGLNNTTGPLNRR